MRVCILHGMTVKDNLSALMEAEGLNPHSLSTKTGVSQPTIFRILEGESKSPRDDTLRPLADFFRVTIQELRYGDFSSENFNTGYPSIPNRDAETSKLMEPGKKYSIKNGIQDVPVVGRAELGPEGFWTETEYPVGHGDGFIPFPTKDQSAYALEAVGDSMAPRIKHKEFIIIEPNAEIHPGDEVLIKTNEDPARSMVKVYQYTRDGRHHLGNINDEFEDFRLEVDKVEKMHLVVAIAKRNMHRYE